MAILTAINPVDMSYNAAWTFIMNPVVGPTSMTWNFGFKNQVITGTFAQNPTTGAVTGTATSMSFSSMGAPEGTVTGLSVNIAGLNTATNNPLLTTPQAKYDAQQGYIFSGNDTATGSAGNDLILTYGGNDSINGGAGDDVLNGGAGNDSILGGLGNDALLGGAGTDTLNGGTGLDMADYSNSTAAVNASLAIAVAQNTGVGSGMDTLVAIEGLQGSSFNDTLTGNAAANKLNGGLGNDILSGGAGNDIIQGGNGNDRIAGGAGGDGLIGGLGVDTFVYSAVGDSTKASTDVILDFTAGVGGDVLNLSAIDAKSATAGVNDAFVLLASPMTGNAPVFTAAGQVQVVGNTVYGNTDANLTTSEIVINLNQTWGGIGAGNFIL